MIEVSFGISIGRGGAFVTIRPDGMDKIELAAGQDGKWINLRTGEPITHEVELAIRHVVFDLGVLFGVVTIGK